MKASKISDLSLDTTLRVSKKARDKLNNLKDEDETFDQYIRKLIGLPLKDEVKSLNIQSTEKISIYVKNNKGAN